MGSVPGPSKKNIHAHGSHGLKPYPTLGPLADLERHLPAEWWRELFTSLYLKTDGDVVENDDATRREVDLLIAETGAKKNQRILDLCCGQGRHSLELARRGYSAVTGIDRSRYLVRLARRRARKAGLAVTFREGDARSVKVAEGSFDLVCMMGNSFGYFDSEEDDVSVLESVQRALVGGGTFAIDITDGAWMREHYEPRSWEWIDQNQFVCRERSLSADGKRLISREVVTHAERGVIADQFYAERLYTREAIVKLIEETGFKSVVVHGVIEGESERGQDLGMMAHRQFLTAVAPPRKLAAMPSRKALSVAVVMGDPSLPDSVKKDGKFNEEDFDTIRRLKAALGELSGYKFTFLDRHAAMIDDFRALKTDLVLNLCDEGYLNDAFKELHVPALLEMLEIPYTGAGPSSLGMCYDKALVRAVAQGLDVPVPLETAVRSGDHLATLPSVFPALLKPAYGDSSIGITQGSVVNNAQELIASLDNLREILPGRPILIQEYLTGTEYSVSLVGNPEGGLDALPILEVDFSGLDANLPPILGYESKWIPESPYWNKIRYRETTATQDIQRALIQYSARLFDALGCRDYARFDFRADAAGLPRLLEVNPNPGWCWDGKLNLMAEFAGMSYADLLHRILESAQMRVGLPLYSDIRDKQARTMNA